MSDNLSADYAAVIKILRDYRRFVRRIAWRFPFSPRAIIRATVIAARTARPDATAGSARIIAAIATAEERASAFYGAVTSQYPLHGVSDILLAAFPDVDFEQILKLHKQRESEINIVIVPKIVGLVFGLGALFFAELPKELVQRYVSDYSTFQELIFGVTIVVIGSFVLLTLPLWILQIWSRFDAQLLRLHIEYTAIRQCSTKGCGA